MAVDFGYFLNRKYNILQQEADQAGITAAANAKNANTTALTGAAAAALDQTRNKLLPAQSAAEIGLTNAQTNLTRQQASVVVPESLARIRSTNADTALTGTQNAIQRYEGLGDTNGLSPFLRAAAGLQQRLGLRKFIGGLGSQGARLTDPLPRRRLGESEASYMDRINGL